MKAIIVSALFLSAGLLTGCGGSSGSSGPTSSTASKVAITSSNQATITNSAIGSATQNLGASDLSYIGGVQTITTSAPVSNEPFMTKWSNYAFKKLQDHQASSLNVTGVVVASQACTTSGTITLDTDGTNSTAPTYLTIAFNNCVENGVTANGTLSMSNIGITQTSNVITGISAKFTYNFTVSNGTTSAGIYGGYTIAATGISTSARTDSITGTTLNFKYGNKFETLSNFAFTSSYNDVTTVSYSDTVDYSFASDVILAGFDFNTITPLVRNVSDVRPSSGQVVISGASNTKLRVTVLPYNASTNPYAGTMSGYVTLELDQGTGLGYGSAVTKTWTQIANNT